MLLSGPAARGLRPPPRSAEWRRASPVCGGAAGGLGVHVGGGGGGGADHLHTVTVTRHIAHASCRRAQKARESQRREPYPAGIVLAVFN